MTWRPTVAPMKAHLRRGPDGKFYGPRAYADVAVHLHVDHGQTVYIGDVLAIHAEDHPGCPHTRPLFASTDPRNRKATP